MSNFSVQTFEQESSDLDLHVKLCAQRYGDLERRISSVETKIDDLRETVLQSRNDIWKILIGCCGTVIVAVISAVATVLSAAP